METIKGEERLKLAIFSCMQHYHEMADEHPADEWGDDDYIEYSVVIRTLSGALAQANMFEEYEDWLAKGGVRAYGAGYQVEC